MNASSAMAPTPEGLRSVSHAPVLPADFVDTSESRYIDIGELRMHPVVRSERSPLLLAHGWSENWGA
jgi:hypothetical protein